MCIGIFTHPCNPTLNSIAIINTHYSANYSNQWLDWACQFGEQIMSSANVMQILHPSWRVCQGWEQALWAALHQHRLNYAAAFPPSTNLAAGAKHICSYCRPVPQVLACFHSVYLGPGMVVYTKRMGIWDMQVLLGETRATVLTEKKVSAWIQATLLFP